MLYYAMQGVWRALGGGDLEEVVVTTGAVHPRDLSLYMHLSLYASLTLYASEASLTSPAQPPSDLSLYVARRHSSHLVSASCALALHVTRTGRQPPLLT
jgi:hypothetical protein